jgi:hypothetical protein
MNLSANPTVRRHEEALLVRARMEAIDAKLAKLVVEGGAKAPPTPPAFSAADIEEVGKLLVTGRLRIPVHARLTVITTVEDVRDKLFNTSAQLIKHEADQIHTKLLRPLTVLEALEAGLILRLGVRRQMI